MRGTTRNFLQSFRKAWRSVTVSGGAIQPLAWVRSWARPGPIPGPKRSRPDSPCALFYNVSDPSRSRAGGHPGPSWSHPRPGRPFQDRAWTGRNRLLGHFQLNFTCVVIFLFWGSPKASHIKASHPHFPHFPRFRFRIFRIFRVFRVFVLRNLLRPLFSWGGRDVRIFRIFPVLGLNR